MSDPPPPPDVRRRDAAHMLRRIVAAPGRITALLLAIGGTAAFIALTLLPAASSLGTLAKKLQERVGCDGVEEVSFPRFPERSTLYAADGSVLARIFLDENRDIVRLDKVSPIAQKAVLAAEDSGFYDHGGVDVRAILRAAIRNIQAGETVQGGSTITQQLVKNVTGDEADTIQRKLVEACRAIAIEQEYTKDEILELYLNEVYFGHGVYGIETASQFYFRKHASALKVNEAALLAGMIAAPAKFDPIGAREKAITRRNFVLGRLEALGWIARNKAERGRTKPLGLSEQAGKLPEARNPFFVQYITNQVVENEDGRFDALGKNERQRIHTLFQGGLSIHTTLRPDWQRWGEEAVRQELPLDTDPQAAISTVDVGTGAIRALVSGRNFLATHQDLVTGIEGRGIRQAGSSFKPFTLVAAFEEGFPPGKVYNKASPIFIPECDDWRPENAEGGSGRGYVDLWTATQDSINVVFAQLIRDVGPEKVVEVAHRMGITTPLPAVCSLTLGAGAVSPLEMSVAYSTLANDGVYCPGYAVQKIVGPAGKVLYRHDPKTECKQVIEPDIAHLVTAMLERVVSGGTGYLANIGRPQAGKTGTNTEYRDAWFVGYVPQYSTAVWVGYPRGQVSLVNIEGFDAVFGGTIPALIWHDYMVRVVQGLAVEDFPAPPPEESGRVPRVVGLPRLEAEEALADANFTPIVEMVPSAEEKGVVVSQSPGAGASLRLGSGVTIFVSTGKPAVVSVPSLTGLTEEEARRRLIERGLEVQVVEQETHDPNQDGIVIDQDPHAGQKIKQGSTVTIVVGRYEEKEKGNGNGNGKGKKP